MFGNIVNDLKDLAQGIAPIPELSDTVKDINTIIKNVNAPLLVMVMGEFSTGKSSFINALVEKEVAIVNAKPTTAVITKLSYGLEDRIIVHFHDGSQKDYNTEDFISLTVEDPSTVELRANINYVERIMPIEMLKSMTIIDSPGLNSLEKSHEDTTRKFMDRADTVIWLFDAHDPCKQSEIDAMKRLNPRLSPLVVLNKIDLLDEEEGDTPENVLADVSRKLRNNRLEVQDIIGLSAKLAFLGKTKNNEKYLSASNIDEFYNKVETIIIPHREAFKKNAVFDDLARVIFGAGTVISGKKTENEKRKNTDYGLYIETEEVLAVATDTLENVVDGFLEFFNLSREHIADEQINKMKLNASARTVFGFLYWLGLFVEKNAEIAQKHLEAAAVRNDNVAQRMMMEICTILGQGEKVRYWEERLGLEINAEKNNFDTTENVINDINKDDTQNVTSCKSDSEMVALSTTKMESSEKRENIESIVQRAEEFYGLKDYKNAFNYYYKAAELGHPAAMKVLGYMYKNGRGITKDYTKAEEWYRRAIAAGDTNAERELWRLLHLIDEEKRNPYFLDIGDKLKKIETETFNLVIVGEFSRGKSTFVNALLGRRILPASKGPTTAVISKIVYGEKPDFKLFYKDGNEPQAIDEKDFVKLTAPPEPDESDEFSVKEYAEAQQRLSRIDYAQISCPLSFCRDGVEVVDTPGTNDLNVGRMEINLGYLRQADAVVLLLAAYQALTASEAQFLKETIVGDNHIQDIFFVISHKDDLDNAEQEQRVIDFHTMKLRAVLPDDFDLDNRIFLVSSLQALYYRRKKNGETLTESQIKRLPSNIEETGIPTFEQALREHRKTSYIRKLEMSDIYQKSLVKQFLVRKALSFLKD